MRKFIWFSICLLNITSNASDLPAHQNQHTKEMSIMKEKNQQKFATLKKLNLPLNHYAISGSGPLGIRNLREMGDVDIVVSPQLRDVLVAQYGLIDNGQVKKVVFPGLNVEAFWEDSFYTIKKDAQTPTVADMIAHAEIIDDLPFVSLQDVVYFKYKMNRKKDLEDILLIKEWEKSNNIK